MVSPSDATRAGAHDPSRSAAARARGRRRRRLAVTCSTLALLLVGGGYTAAAGLTPLPELRAALTVDAGTEVAADTSIPETVVAGQALPTAIGWADGDEVWANDDEPRQIASITKLVTALVGLSAAPVEPGSDGPLYTVTQQDAAVREEVLAVDGVVADTPIGLQLTTRQLLELMLLPSANNYAIAYAHSIFGDDAGFADAASAWAERQGLASVRVVEPSGLSPENVSTASDLVRLARMALADPLVSEIVAERSAEIPGIGTIESTNPLLGIPGVVGLKTGTTFSAGYNLLAAQRDAGDGDREPIAIVAVLGRDSSAARAEDAQEALGSAAGALQSVAMVGEGEELGAITTWSGERVGLLASTGVQTGLLPGEAARRTVELGPVGAGPAGSPAGEVRIGAPRGIDPVPIVTSAAIREPGLWWRLSHPAIVFGWEEPAVAG